MGSSRPASVYGPGTLALSVASPLVRRLNRLKSSTVPKPLGASIGQLIFVFATLVVGKRAEPARRSTLKFYPLKEAVKRQVEVEPGLLAVSYHVEPGGELIVHCGDDSIIDHLLAVDVAELLEVLAGELEPTGEGVAADDGRS